MLPSHFNSHFNREINVFLGNGTETTRDSFGKKEKP